MRRNIVTYGIKALYLLLAWAVIVYGCVGDINVNLLCISVFTYSGGITFDSLFYMYNALVDTTILNKIIRGTAILSFVVNCIISILSLVCHSFLLIPFDEQVQMYMIKVNTESVKGIQILYPNLLNWSISLRDMMTLICAAAVGSLIPAVLLEVDSYIRLRNNKIDKTNIK